MKTNQPCSITAAWNNVAPVVSDFSSNSYSQDKSIFAFGHTAGYAQAMAQLRPMVEAGQYFLDRVEGRHPDGPIASRRTYGRFKKAMEFYLNGEGSNAESQK